MITRLILSLFAVVFALGAEPSFAQERRALVIGNQDYSSVPKLSRAKNDAEAIGAVLNELGFDVTKALDADEAEMGDAIDSFVSKISPGDTVVVHFSGHGVEIDGRNYLLPVDAPSPDTASDSRLRRTAFDLRDAVIDPIRRKGARVTFAVIDACRDNPYVGATKSIGATRGLGRMDAEEGEFLLFSAQPGQKALDALPQNDNEATSVFTRVFVRHLAKPGQPLVMIAKATQEDVKTLARDGAGFSQFPDYVDRIIGMVPLVEQPPPTGANDAILPNPAPPIEPTSALSVAALLSTPADADSFASEQSTAATQRAFLFEEDPENPQSGRNFDGNVTWRTELVSTSASAPLETAIRGQIDIPERKIKVQVTIRRNTDPYLPASHTAELQFVVPADFPNGGVQNVPGILMKDGQTQRGLPLSGLSVKVTNAFFLVGLSDPPAEAGRNSQLLRERTWIDLPILYENGRRAILSVEKGVEGEKAFADAFTAWADKPAVQTPGPAAPTDPEAVATASVATADSITIPPQLLDPPADATALVASEPDILPATDPAPTTGGEGGFVVQIAAAKSINEADATLRAAQLRFAALLKGQPTSLKRVEIDGRGTIYRIRIGPLETRDAAVSLCSSLKLAGGDCVVAKN